MHSRSLRYDLEYIVLLALVMHHTSRVMRHTFVFCYPTFVTPALLQRPVVSRLFSVGGRCGSDYDVEKKGDDDDEDDDDDDDADGNADHASSPFTLCHSPITLHPSAVTPQPHVGTFRFATSSSCKIPDSKPQTPNHKPKTSILKP